MADSKTEKMQKSVQQRLIDAAFELFLEEDYNTVTTRKLALKANTSASMISYYFGDKQKLYNEMVREQFRSIAQALEQSYTDDKGLDFSVLMLKYLEIHNKNPDFPAFITKILAYKNGPGYMLFAEILDNKRDLIQKIMKKSQLTKHMSEEVDIDVLRITMMSMTVFPFLIKGVLEHSTRMNMDQQLMEKVARFTGEILNTHTKPSADNTWLNLNKH